MNARVLLASLAIVLPLSALPSQTPPRSLTELIVGGGMPPMGGIGLSPSYTVGLQLNPAGQKLSFRVMAEFFESQSAGANEYRSQSNTGAQLLGVRTFGTGRLQAHFVAGLGLYSTKTSGIAHQYAFDGTGVVQGPAFEYSKNAFRAVPIIGTGASLRVLGMNLFGEVKLPTFYPNGFHHGPYSPLIIGVRF